eukprot:Skav232804  [mRNA]  locus=scaffold614:410446:414504:- [translate_table: standard]
MRFRRGACASPSHIARLLQTVAIALDVEGARMGARAASRRALAAILVVAACLSTSSCGFCRSPGVLSRWRTKAFAEREPRELVDLYGMKTRELKAFLKQKGVQVEDCFDMDSLIQRAAATEEDWATPQRQATQLLQGSLGLLLSSPISFTAHTDTQGITKAKRDVIRSGLRNAKLALLVVSYVQCLLC